MYSTWAVPWSDVRRVSRPRSNRFEPRTNERDAFLIDSHYIVLGGSVILTRLRSVKFNFVLRIVE